MGEQNYSTSKYKNRANSKSTKTLEKEGNLLGELVIELLASQTNIGQLGIIGNDQSLTEITL